MLFSWRIFAADFRGGFSWRTSSGGFCGGFPWRISVADFPWRISVADLLGGFCVADFRGGFAWRILRRILLFFGGGFAADFSKSCGGFLRRICSGPKPCKLHVKIAPKIHHKNPPHSSPHARLVCDYTLPAFFTACFAACPSTGILHYVTYTADFFRGKF